MLFGEEDDNRKAGGCEGDEGDEEDNNIDDGDEWGQQGLVQK